MKIGWSLRYVTPKSNDLILHIESATKKCSIALSSQGVLVGQKELLSEKYRHSEVLHQFIEELLSEVSVDYSQLEAIAVSEGPGSFTGLRIGVSTAKAMCYALGIPLISINTLEIMVQNLKLEPDQVVLSLLDARNNNVYALGLDHQKKVIKNTWMESLNLNSFQELSKGKSLVVVGNGQHKLKQVQPDLYCQYIPAIILPTAVDMVGISYKKFLGKQFEDLMDFQPNYLHSSLAYKI